MIFNGQAEFICQTKPKIPRLVISVTTEKGAFAVTVGLASAALALVVLFSSIGCDNSAQNPIKTESINADKNGEDEIGDNLEFSTDLDNSTEPAPRINPMHRRDAIVAAMDAGDYLQAQRLADEATSKLATSRLFQLLRADAAFMNLDIEGAINAYNAIIEVQPNQKPYLWQRGLAFYYASQFKSGVEQFESHATVNATDVENSVWHMLCAAQVDGFDSAQKNMIPVRGDSRKWSGQVYGLFAGTCTPAELTFALPADDDASSQDMTNRYYTNLYLGLYYEALGKQKESLETMRRAAECNPYDGNVLMGQIARIHVALKGK